MATPQTQNDFAVFLNNIAPNSSFILSTGKQLIFAAGQLLTNIKSEIAELMQQVEDGHPHISYNGLITKEDLDPMLALKRKIIEEYQAEQRAAANQANRDTGSYKEDGLKGIASTKELGELAGESSSMAEGGQAAGSTNTPTQGSAHSSTAIISAAQSLLAARKAK